MTFRSFTIWFWSLLGLAFLLLLVSGLIAAFAPLLNSEVKRVIAGFGLLGVAAAFSVNAAAGMRHGKLWARGGVTTREEQREGWFRYMVGMNVAIALLATFATYRIWSGAVPVFP
jgi:hypothetical protein